MAAPDWNEMYKPLKHLREGGLGKVVVEEMQTVEKRLNKKVFQNIHHHLEVLERFVIWASVVLNIYSAYDCQRNGVKA